MCCVVAGVCIAAMAPLPLAFRPTANSNLDPAWIAAGVDSGLGRILPRSSSSRATCDAMATAPCRSLADRYSRRRMASRDCARARQRERVIGVEGITRSQQTVEGCVRSSPRRRDAAAACASTGAGARKQSVDQCLLAIICFLSPLSLPLPKIEIHPPIGSNSWPKTARILSPSPLSPKQNTGVPLGG